MTRDKTGRMTRFGRFPRLETERLVLRRMTLDDLGFYFEHFSRKEVVEGQGFPAPENMGAAKEELEMYCIKNFEQNTGIRWGITFKGRKGLIGTCGVYKWVKEDGYSAEMGYDLDPEYWGMGIMTEALEVIIRYAFETMRLHRIEVRVMPHNKRSMRLLKRLGFKKEGVLREHKYMMGEFQTDVVFSMLEQEWKGKRAQG
jgi:ribosomal-protein-alanine N-acetyltransferase